MVASAPPVRLRDADSAASYALVDARATGTESKGEFPASGVGGVSRQAGALRSVRRAARDVMNHEPTGDTRARLASLPNTTEVWV